MARKTYIVREPTAEYVEQRRKSFAGEARFFGVDPAIALAFKTFPTNTSFDDVLIKATLVDRLYSTNVYAVFDMARHITDLEIDGRLDVGDPNLVEDIALLKREGATRRHYSFATKYCSFSRPDAFHIYDTYVEWLLWEYQKQFRFGDFERAHLWTYPTFASIVSSFIQRFGLQHLTAKELDKFLWIEAGTLEPAPELLSNDVAV